MEDYLEQVIPRVMTEKRFTSKEGVVQAAVSAFIGDSSRVMVDREVVPSFADTATRKMIRDQFSRPLVEAIEHAKPAPGKRPTNFGMECDALSLDAAGHLVAVEVKPGNVGTLAWVAAQATMYARVLQHWVDLDGDWQATVTRMFGQRRALGVVSPAFQLPKLERKVVPAVAFQRIANPAFIARMYDVQDALIDAGVGDPDMKFYEVSLSGRLVEHQRP